MTTGRKPRKRRAIKPLGATTGAAAVGSGTAAAAPGTAASGAPFDAGALAGVGGAPIVIAGPAPDAAGSIATTGGVCAVKSASLIHNPSLRNAPSHWLSGAQRNK